MANVTNSQPFPGTTWLTIDTTADFAVGDAAQECIGTVILQVEGTGWTGTVLPKGRLLGADGASVGWISIAYQNLNTGNDIAGGTTITGDGLFAIRLDVGVELQLVTTTAAGSVDLLIRRGIG